MPEMSGALAMRTLGRTGLRVSVMGLGCGGPSRIGLATGKSDDEQAAIVRTALDAGINFVDTAEAYGTEEAVGRAIRGRPRESFVLSTKKSTNRLPLTAQDITLGLENSLRRLGVDYVDIYHMHGVAPQHYEAIASEAIPALQRLRDQGKLRWLGITEAGASDPGHQMLQRALADGVWDVMMVMFNLLNQSARTRVFEPAMRKDVGILIMFAVRRALSRPERLREVVRELVAAGQVDPADLDLTDPLGWLAGECGAASIPDAAYRFCRDEPGVHVVLSGTGEPAHLAANLESFGRPPLAPACVARLKHIFRHADSVSGN